MNKSNILLTTLLLSNIALAEPCTILNYTSAGNVNSLTGVISVTTVQTGNILKDQDSYREVIQIEEADGTFTLTTVDLPYGPTGPSGITPDQCD